MSERTVAEAFHPSEFIIDEMEARGWSREDVVDRMPFDRRVNRIALDLYLECGPTEPNIRLGEMARDLAVAFDVSPEYFRNLEAAWLAYVTKDPAHD